MLGIFSKALLIASFALALTPRPDPLAEKRTRCIESLEAGEQGPLEENTWGGLRAGYPLTTFLQLFFFDRKESTGSQAQYHIQNTEVIDPTNGAILRLAGESDVERWLLYFENDKLRGIDVYYPARLPEKTVRDRLEKRFGAAKSGWAKGTTSARLRRSQSQWFLEVRFAKGNTNE